MASLDIAGCRKGVAKLDPFQMFNRFHPSAFPHWETLGMNISGCTFDMIISNNWLKMDDRGRLQNKSSYDEDLITVGTAF